MGENGVFKGGPYGPPLKNQEPLTYVKDNGVFLYYICFYEIHAQRWICDHAKINQLMEEKDEMSGTR
jgi:hypothetical protein